MCGCDSSPNNSFERTGVSLCFASLDSVAVRRSTQGPLGRMNEPGFPPLASISRRFVSHLFDWFVYFGFAYGYLAIFGSPNQEGALQVEGLLALPVLAAWWIYFAVPEALVGRTLGKWLFDLQVKRISGDEVHAGQAFKRRLCDILDFALSLGFVAFFMAKRLPLRQRLGDLVAGTIVVRTQS